MKTQLQAINFILIVALSCYFQFAKGQIVYTDVNPDQTYSSGSYNLDLNIDGTNDFTITLTSGTAHYDCVSCNGSGTVTTETLKAASLANSEIGVEGAQLDKNLLIDSTLSWSGATQTMAKLKCSGGHCIFYNSFCGPIVTLSGDWIYGATDKYLGLRIHINTQIYYGWIRLDVVDDAASFIIKDYAYNSIPYQSILAGQTCPPQAKITTNGPTTFCVGDSVILSSVNSGTNLSYQWKLNGINVYGATNKSFIAKVAGNYKVKVTDNTHSCSASSAKVKVKVPCKMMDEDEKVEGNLVSIYPNPLAQSTLITFQLQTDENVSLKIFDVAGRLIRTLANDAMSAGAHELTWDARDENGNAVSAGIYLLQFFTREDSETMRLAVAK